MRTMMKSLFAALVVTLLLGAFPQHSLASGDNFTIDKDGNVTISLKEFDRVLGLWRPKLEKNCRSFRRMSEVFVTLPTCTSDATKEELVGIKKTGWALWRGALLRNNLDPRLTPDEKALVDNILTLTCSTPQHSPREIERMCNSGTSNVTPNWYKKSLEELRGLLKENPGFAAVND